MQYCAWLDVQAIMVSLNGIIPLIISSCTKPVLIIFCMWPVYEVADENMDKQQKCSST